MQNMQIQTVRKKLKRKLWNNWCLDKDAALQAMNEECEIKMMPQNLSRNVVPIEVHYVVMISVLLVQTTQKNIIKYVTLDFQRYVMG